MIRRSSTIPVIMVSRKNAEADRVLGLEMGADDYITKPFSERELIARIRAALRRRESPLHPSPNTLQVGPVRMYVDQHRTTLSGKEIHLPPIEFSLLKLFLENPGRALKRDAIIAHIWGEGIAGHNGALTQHIRRLRAKIDSGPDAPKRIITIQGIGYRFHA
ncbi:response regulator transcription factor [Streptomyces sp. NPDC004787]|uniref:response regulator transcription factor n=1 Tax=Streptomyces sp. NPDC004787 TaxID=3154291 RepID=UPI0033A68A46